MSDHISSLEVRHDAPSVIHNVSQEELLYMRAKGLSWKNVEEAEKALARRKKTALYVIFFLLCGFLGFLFFKAYHHYQDLFADETTISTSEFFVSTDKLGVLNSTHQWLDARPVRDSEPSDSNSSSSDSNSVRHSSGRLDSGRDYVSGSDVDRDSESGTGEEIPREHRHPLDSQESGSAPPLLTRSRSHGSSTTTTNTSASTNLTEPSTTARSDPDLDTTT